MITPRPVRTPITAKDWCVEPFAATYTLPAILHEIRVADWSTGLVGDQRGCVVAYVPGGYSDDDDTRAVAAANAALIAKAPLLQQYIAKLEDRIDELERENAKLRLGRDLDDGYIEFLEDQQMRHTYRDLWGEYER